MENNNVVLVMGKPNTGKSTSLMNLPQKDYVYLNTDLKQLPFKSHFIKNVGITDPMHIFEYIQQINAVSEIEGTILDTITFLMAMFEQQYVQSAVNTQKAWGDYGIFYKQLIHAIKTSTKTWAILAHEETKLNEQSGFYETAVPIKGSTSKIGVEADFTTILAAKQIPVSKLKEYENDLLHITPEEEEDGFKYVFQTRCTRDTVGEKMRSAMGLWSRKELYIDNDLNQVFKRLKDYYA